MYERACFGHRIQNKGQPQKNIVAARRTRDDTICLDCMVIYNDWSTTLECSTVFGYIKDDSSRDETECRTECMTEYVINQRRVVNGEAYQPAYRDIFVCRKE